MLPIIAIGLALTLSACTPLAPIQAGAYADVMADNYMEDPDKDEEEQSILEGIDDVLSGPMNMLNSGISANLAFFWSVGDLVVGNEGVGARDN